LAHPEAIIGNARAVVLMNVRREVRGDFMLRNGVQRINKIHSAPIPAVVANLGDIVFRQQNS
jgi:hypothetical protein